MTVKMYDRDQNRWLFEFHERPNGHMKNEGWETEETEIEGVDFIAAAVEQLMKVLRNKAVHVYQFRISFCGTLSKYTFKQCTSRMVGELEKEMRKLTHQISVDLFGISNGRDSDHIPILLRYIKLDPLLILHISPTIDCAIPYNYFSCFDIDLSKVSESEHWKIAGSVKLERYSVPVDCPETMHIPFLHFNLPNLNLEDVKFIVKVSHSCVFPIYMTN